MYVTLSFFSLMLFFLLSFNYPSVKMLYTELSHLYDENYLKQASPKAANIHNRW